MAADTPEAATRSSAARAGLQLTGRRLPLGGLPDGVAIRGVGVRSADLGRPWSSQVSDGFAGPTRVDVRLITARPVVWPFT